MSPTVRPVAGAFLVVVLLLAGALVGVLLDHAMMDHRFFHHFGGPPSRTRMLDHLQKELQLTPVQRAEVDSIFRVHEKGVLAMRSQMRAMFDSSRVSLHAALQQVLTPVQMEKLRRLEPRGGHGWGGGRRGHGRHGFDGPGGPPPPDNDSGPEGEHR